MIGPSQQRQPMKQHQRGAVLFVSLVVLIMLSLFAITTANTSLMEQKMAGATRNMQLATIAADSALNDAKIKISAAAATYGAENVCSHLRCFVRLADAPDAPVDLMQTDQARAATNPFRLDLTQLQGIDQSAQLAASPGYVIEDLGMSPLSTQPTSSEGQRSNRVFRITAIGFGGQVDYDRAVESTYVVGP